jgi:hypothetical protein
LVVHVIFAIPLSLASHIGSVKTGDVRQREASRVRDESLERSRNLSRRKKSLQSRSNLSRVIEISREGIEYLERTINPSGGEYFSRAETKSLERRRGLSREEQYLERGIDILKGQEISREEKRYFERIRDVPREEGIS